jgi:hypothetical protein
VNETVLPIRGLYRDLVTTTTGQDGFDSGWRANTIVTRCRILLSAFMANDHSRGIQHLAVGQGEERWDRDGTPSSPETTTTLTSAFDPPLSDLDIDYLDDGDIVQTPPAPRLQIAVTLGPDYPAPLPGRNSYPLREFGLFGQLDDTPYMINSIRHPVIHKEHGTTLIRTIRLYL